MNQPRRFNTPCGRRPGSEKRCEQGTEQTPERVPWGIAFSKKSVVEYRLFTGARAATPPLALQKSDWVGVLVGEAKTGAWRNALTGGNKPHIVAKAETKGYVQASHRACDWQPRRRSG